MTATKRMLMLKAVGRFYRSLDSGRDCFYCGCIYPEDQDHVPALNLVMDNSAAYYREQAIPLYLVRCCRECNVQLGSKPLLTLEKRAVFLYAKTQKMFAHRRLKGDWEPEEIAEMGRGLRPMIQALAKRKDYLWDRLVGLSNTIVKYDEEGWPFYGGSV